MTLGDRLRTRKTCVLSGAQLSRRVGLNFAECRRFSSHWDALVPDRYAAELGTTRLRRYGQFMFTSADGSTRLMPHGVFTQPDHSNPLYVDRGRMFEPLTEAFTTEPLVLSLLSLLGGVAGALDDVAEWTARVTPFRVLASSDAGGDPTPEGPHRDGVTLVTSLLIGKDNSVGGISTVYDLAHTPILKTTLREPGTMLLGDDRCTLHRVSPIRPLDPSRPARRDVLVITFAPYR